MITEEIRAVLLAKADALLRRSADDMAALLTGVMREYETRWGLNLDVPPRPDNAPPPAS